MSNLMPDKRICHLREIRVDTRTAKVVAGERGISVHTVNNIRCGTNRGSVA